MRQTRLQLSASFPDAIGYLAIMRSPIPEVGDAFLATLHGVVGRAARSRDEYNAERAAFSPPDWLGYYAVSDRAYVFDGKRAVAVPMVGPFEDMLQCLRRQVFPRLGTRMDMPIELERITPVRQEPSHMLLHHLPSGETYMEPFEPAVCFLRNQFTRN